MNPVEAASLTRAADGILHHVRWHPPEIALELAQVLGEVAARHPGKMNALARGAERLRAELVPDVVPLA